MFSDQIGARLSGTVAVHHSCHQQTSGRIPEKCLAKQNQFPLLSIIRTRCMAVVAVRSRKKVLRDYLDTQLRDAAADGNAYRQDADSVRS